MRSKPARLGEISFDFVKIPHRRDENVSYEHAQVGQPGKGGIDFSLISSVLFFRW